MEKEYEKGFYFEDLKVTLLPDMQCTSDILRKDQYLLRVYLASGMFRQCNLPSNLSHMKQNRLSLPLALPLCSLQGL